MKHYVRRNNCFDLLRYLFALLIVAFHFSVLTHAEWSEMMVQSGPLSVKAFFVMTGFLVAYSFLQHEHHLQKYFRKRFERILPAYVVVVLFCFLLGMMLSSYSVADFLASKESWKYLGSNLLMLNWLQPSLPGTFTRCHMTAVDGSLWTMKFELLFYVLLPLFVRALRSSVGYYLLGAWVLATFWIYPQAPPQLKYFCFFLSGMGVLFSIDWLNRGNRFRNVFVCSVLIELLLYVPSYDGMPLLYEQLRTLEVFSYPIFLIYLAYNLPVPKVLLSLPNVTYGIYLYHFPVVQAIVQTGVFRGHGLLMFLSVYGITFVLAILSYMFIERKYIRSHIAK